MKPVATKNIITERLILRAPAVADAADLVAARSLAMTIPEAEKALADMAAEAKKPFGFHWVITLNGRAIGRVKGWEVHPYNGYVQLGYDTAPEMRNHGVMTEAVGGVLRYMFEEAEANRVYCSIREGNLASRRVCEKNGMQHEGILRQHYARQDGGYDDVHIYGILRSEWLKGEK